MTPKTLTLQDLLRTDFAPGGGTQEYFVNMGPQHPATHGVLRLLLKLDGETLRQVIPVLGYIHRGIEKICEHQTYRQIVHLSDRLDYLSALANNWCVTRVVERAAGIETNERIETIRTLMAELERLQSHTLWWGVFGMDLGAFTPFLHGFRDREELTQIFEDTIGARLTMNYIQPGGLLHDLHKDFAPRVRAWLKDFGTKVDEYDRMLSGNLIAQKRLVDIGALSGDEALGLGATGPVLRASGVPWDLRRVRPYGVYDQLDFVVPVGEKGDCWDRYWVRIEEMRQSLALCETLIENIPEGKTMLVKPAAKIRLPEGTFYEELETPRGIFGVHLHSRGKDMPWRFHFRSPNLHNLWCITKIAPGARVADIVAMLAGLDLIVPDMDR